MWVEYDDGVSVVLEKFERFSTQQEAPQGGWDLVGFREGKEPVTLGRFPGAECARLVLGGYLLEHPAGPEGLQGPADSRRVLAGREPTVPGSAVAGHLEGSPGGAAGRLAPAVAEIQAAGGALHPLRRGTAARRRGVPRRREVHQPRRWCKVYHLQPVPPVQSQSIVIQ